MKPANETSRYQFAQTVQPLMRGFGQISGILLFQKPSVAGANRGSVHPDPSQKPAADVFRNEFHVPENVCHIGGLLRCLTR
jgi:hypothetical protein